ncbi:unnamed protein product [Anisakis simplex]|uniref:Regulator of telomere elongation helicase 1 homolog (inferred by orthology to a C. elegans protein) n=1 Tax=Anisakis simplex TaxID=6269 RepID=A0A0M3KCJ4_ANISI|nr:unnamed protein product [Anisakis simplex]
MCDDADLILVPYNYVVDARLRKSHEINIEGNVVIFDEAHNLESVCEESASYSFTSKQLSKCIKEAKTVLKSVMEDEEEIRSKMVIIFCYFQAEEYHQREILVRWISKIFILYFCTFLRNASSHCSS